MSICSFTPCTTSSATFPKRRRCPSLCSMARAPSSCDPAHEVPESQSSDQALGRMGLDETAALGFAPAQALLGSVDFGTNALLELRGAALEPLSDLHDSLL